MMANFPGFARVSARIHPSEKEKLKKSGYNAREAIQYFNKVYSNEVDRLSIDEYFLNLEIEDLKEELISKEKRLDAIQKRKDDIYKSHLSELRVNSYQKIIAMYNNTETKTCFEDFVEMRYIEQTMISESGTVQCPLDEYKEGLLDYYCNVILVGRTSEI